MLTRSYKFLATIKGDKFIKKYGEEITFNNPALFPEQNIVDEYLEPFVIGTIITPGEEEFKYEANYFLTLLLLDTYLGPVMSLCMEKRGRQLSSKNLDQTRIVLQFALPLTEIVIDFHDRLKSLTSGYASFDYEDMGYEASSLVKVHKIFLV